MICTKLKLNFKIQNKLNRFSHYFLLVLLLYRFDAGKLLTDFAEPDLVDLVTGLVVDVVVVSPTFADVAFR